MAPSAARAGSHGLLETVPWLTFWEWTTNSQYLWGLATWLLIVQENTIGLAVATFIWILYVAVGSILICDLQKNVVPFPSSLHKHNTGIKEISSSPLKMADWHTMPSRSPAQLLLSAVNWELVLCQGFFSILEESLLNSWVWDSLRLPLFSMAISCSLWSFVKTEYLWMGSLRFFLLGLNSIIR